MTWWLTLAGPPRAGANSKPYDYKQKVQEMKELQKMNFTENPSSDFRPKKNKKSSHCMENQTKEPQDTDGKNWTWTM